MADKPSQQQLVRQSRFFLKDTIRKTIDLSQTDQGRRIEAPPIEKPCAPGARRIDLPRPGAWTIPPTDLEQAIRERRSRRDHAPDPLSIGEIAFLLWATQGLRGPVTGAHALPPLVQAVPPPRPQPPDRSPAWLSGGTLRLVERRAPRISALEVESGAARHDLLLEHNLIVIPGTTYPGRVQRGDHDEQRAGGT